MLQFDISKFEPDVHDTIMQNQQWTRPFVKTNRKIMDTYNFSIVGYDTDRITEMLEVIYNAQRWSYKVRFSAFFIRFFFVALFFVFKTTTYFRSVPRIATICLRFAFFMF